MKFFLFHLMPYGALDLNYEKDSDTSWMRLPNRYYDKHEGRALYNRYIDELVYGEQLGFDGVGVNEHHQTAYGMMPSPIVIASMLVQRTKSVKIAILGSALPLRDHPLTIAEEHAMIDTISGGRLVSGFVRGIGAEYHVFGSNPANSHPRFHEAHDLIIEAWTREGPFAFEGKHYHFNYVNMWPKPFQEPHPPIWIPSQGSQETIEWASHPDRRYTYLQTFSPVAAVHKYIQMYREEAENYGYTADDSQVGWAVPIYVAETDAQAQKEAKVHFENFRNKFLKMPMEMLLPPGYLGLASTKRVMGAKKQLGADITMEQAMDLGMFYCGSPETITQKFSEESKKLGLGYLLTLLQFGTLPADLTKKNMELFAREVMPKLRAEQGEEAPAVAAE